MFNIISYYIMSQRADGSVSPWQGWFTLKNSSTFCNSQSWLHFVWMDSGKRLSFPVQVCLWKPIPSAEEMPGSAQSSVKWGLWRQRQASPCSPCQGILEERVNRKSTALKLDHVFGIPESTQIFRQLLRRRKFHKRVTPCLHVNHQQIPSDIHCFIARCMCGSLHSTFGLPGPAHKSTRSQNAWTSNVAGPRVCGPQVWKTIFLRKTTEEKLALNLCSLYLKELNDKPGCL